MSALSVMDDLLLGVRPSIRVRHVKVDGTTHRGANDIAIGDLDTDVWVDFVHGSTN